MDTNTIVNGNNIRKEEVIETAGIKRLPYFGFSILAYSMISIGILLADGVLLAAGDFSGFGWVLIIFALLMLAIASYQRLMNLGANTLITVLGVIAIFVPYLGIVVALVLIFMPTKVWNVLYQDDVELSRS